ncbi:MAG: hypothetical protein COA78_28670 [Blastopirellula sp.]|nr:MAG: hypothetical protein COA78_28670 [Blastopirellula sp.]
MKKPKSTFLGFIRREPWQRCRPVVIGGCARSGTTLLLSLLSSHPRIYAIPVETQTLCPTAYYGDYDANAALDIPALNDYLAAANITRQSRLWCEKTPRNIHFFESILSHFGKSVKLLQIVRDGRDVVCSMHPDNAMQNWVQPHRWVQDVTAGLAFQAHAQVLTIRFEDLIVCFEKTVQDICDFLDIDLTHHLNEYPKYATVKTSNAWNEPAQLPSSSSIGKWRTNKKNSKVIDELMANEDAIRLLQHYDYL